MKEIYEIQASRFRKEVRSFSEAEKIARNLVYHGKRVEILQDDVIVAKAREKDGLLVWDIHPNGPRREKLEGGPKMGKFRLIGGGVRRSFVSFEDKVKAVSDIYVKGKNPKEVLTPFYQKAERELPKNTSIIVANWRKTIQDKLDRDDEFTINLCKTYNIIEEGAAPTPAKRHRKK